MIWCFVNAAIYSKYVPLTSTNLFISVTSYNAKLWHMERELSHFLYELRSGQTSRLVSSLASSIAVFCEIIVHFRVNNSLGTSYNVNVWIGRCFCMFDCGREDKKLTLYGIYFSSDDTYWWLRCKLQYIWLNFNLSCFL